MSTDFGRRLAGVAQGEHQSFAGIPETDRRLYDRIYRTYLAELKAADPGDSLGWAMPRDITTWPWSAVFVSWCVLAAGANKAEFDFSIRHAVYVAAAIRRADQGTGVFRGRRITDYAPQVGDIVAANRQGGRVTYDQARTRDSYNSHSAIVVDIVTRGGKRYAVTVGGNEGSSVGRAELELLASGKLKPRAYDPYICVIETLKTAAVAPAVQPVVESPPPAGLPAAFRKHGTFIYDAAATIRDYGSAEKVVAAMQRAGMSHAWVRIHGVTPNSAPVRATTKALIAALRAGGVDVAGWGWCQGADPAGDARMAVRELRDYGLDDYIADIEPEHNNSQWTVSEIQTFCSAVRRGMTGGFAVSSFALIDWHRPELLAAAAPYVDAFAPQIYWFNFPNRKMVDQFRRPDGSAYLPNDPGQYADLCLDRWRRVLQQNPRPLILTGQAYWGEGGFDQLEAEAKLEAFLARWSGYGRVAGVNWWHFGGGGGMSHAMLEDIGAARLGTKPYG